MMLDTQYRLDAERSRWDAHTYLIQMMQNSFAQSVSNDLMRGIERYVEARTRLMVIEMFKNENLFEIMMKAAGESK